MKYQFDPKSVLGSDETGFKSPEGFIHASSATLKEIADEVVELLKQPVGIEEIDAQTARDFVDLRNAQAWRN